MAPLQALLLGFLTAFACAAPSVDATATDWLRTRVWVAGREHPEGERPVAALGRGVAADYLRRHGARVRSGKLFDAVDIVGTLSMVVIDQRLSAELFGEQDPVGSIVVIDRIGSAQVVGVIEPRPLEPGPAPDLPRFYWGALAP